MKLNSDGPCKKLIGLCFAINQAGIANDNMEVKIDVNQKYHH